jgi:hypothetical protein
LGQWHAAGSDADQAQTNPGAATIGELARDRGDQTANLVRIA